MHDGKLLRLRNTSWVISEPVRANEGLLPREIFSEQPISPKGLVVPCSLAQLLRREAAAAPHLPDHVRLVGKARGRGKFGPVNTTILDSLVQFAIELLRVANAVQISLADARP